MEKDNSRRDFIKKAAWTAPVVMTLSAVPAMAQAGSSGSSPDKCPDGLEGTPPNCRTPT